MRKLKIAYRPMGEDAPFTHYFLPQYRELQDFIKKTLATFINDFNKAEGYGQFTEEEATTFKEKWIDFQTNLKQVLEALKVTPPNLTKKGCFSYSRHLARLFTSKIHFRYRQELLRWKQVLKGIEAKILSRSTQYPSVKDPVTNAFAEALNNLNSIVKLLQNKE